MNTKYKTFILSVGLSLLTAMATAMAQSPAPNPTPTEAGTEDRTLASSFEFGFRGLKVEGDREKYKSDLNYHAGFRLFDSSLYFEDSTTGRKPFDSALLQFSGFGSDPQGNVRFSGARTGFYKIDSNIRRVTYFNNLKNHAPPWSQAVPTGSTHKFLDTKHEFGDIDLTVFPESNDFRMRFGYSFNTMRGPGAWTVRFPSMSGVILTPLPAVNPNAAIRGDEYIADSHFSSKANDFRLGVEGKVGGFNMGLNFGHRQFRDGTNYLINSTNIGLDPTNPTTGFTSQFNRAIRTKGSVNWTQYYVNRTFARKLDFTGRIIYSSAVSKPNEVDSAAGRTTSPANTIIDAYTSNFGGYVKRPQTRADIGFTYRANESVRISNTFTLDQFNNSGNQLSIEQIIGTIRTGTPAANYTGATLSLNHYRTEGLRRLSNLIEGDFQVSNRFSFHLGYRFTKRRLLRSSFDINNGVLAAAGVGFEEVDNTTNSVIFGARAKPAKNWSIFLDLERGKNDNVFIRLANNDVFNFRVRSRTSWGSKLVLNLAAIFKNNEAEGESTPIPGSGTTIVFPSTLTLAKTRSQYYSTNLEYMASDKVTFSGGYTFNKQKSEADIIVPIGAPLFPTTTWFLGRSEYYAKDSYFFFDVNARLAPRFSIYAAYRINDDKAQGDRVATRPQDIITGYPMRYQTPEVKMTFKVSRNIDWNLGYQYFSYSEKPYFNPFTAVPYTGYPYTQTFPAQNYKAHMPYTSLRIYFGNGAADR
jgi:hypothetical protein